MTSAKKLSAPSVTVDDVVFLWKDADLHVLLAKRDGEPFGDKWSFPGGAIELDESLDKAAKRLLKDEAGLRGVELEQFKAFGDPKRDPRGRSISIVFLGLADDSKSNLTASGDATEVQWGNLTKLPKLALDHKKILAEAVQRLKERVIHQLDGESTISEAFPNSELREVLLYLYSYEKK